MRINLAAIADAAWRAAVDEELEKILANGATLAHAVDDLVNERL